MANLKRCDLCGAEAEDLMSISFPYEERWMLFFHKNRFAHYADICVDCLELIRELREKQREMENVDIVVEREGE